MRQHRLSGRPSSRHGSGSRGDAVQRVWSVADAGGLTLVEVANDSTAADRFAFTRRDVLTARPPADVPVEGIELPASTIVLPIGHRSLRHRRARPHPAGRRALPARLPGADATARGWRSPVRRRAGSCCPTTAAADHLVDGYTPTLLLAGCPRRAP